ncbi:WYL domain-containing protein [Ammoniphilus resinae]|uniref:DNA-binding transcriptional regulator YafY n=1 Tax=Ammoniphilus resinae TaxID=861532 RepID=A0ABS4GSU4_9BACL|nr:WYL domain-containing protein [Ammoniphilus resinae]MBP1933363.1 putative DNA-binding transcriptional regulator YafY [Ammoniphilus resinae]
MNRKETKPLQKFSDKWYRLVIFDALYRFSSKDKPMKVSQLTERIMDPQSETHRYFENLELIARTVDRTLQDLVELQMPIANMMIHKHPIDRPATYYAEPAPMRRNRAIQSPPHPKILETIYEAIKDKKLLTFKYKREETLIEEERIVSRDRSHTIRVIALDILTYKQMDEEMYYLIAYDEEGQIKHFLMKEMSDLSLKFYSLDVERPIYEKNTYKYQHPYLIEGNPIRISLRIKGTLYRELVKLCGKEGNQFGPSGVTSLPIQANVTATAEGLMKWCLANIGRCEILSPEDLRMKFIEQLKLATDSYQMKTEGTIHV